MLKRVTTTCMVMSLLSASASAHSILWVSTSDHTDLVKDEEYETEPVVLFMAPGVEDDAVPLIEETDSGLEILYEELGPPEELAGVDEVVSPDLISVEEAVQLDLISVEEEPEAPEEIELEEITNDQIQEP